MHTWVQVYPGGEKSCSAAGVTIYHGLLQLREISSETVPDFLTPQPNSAE